jgi:preprotein translocase subunit SecE
LGVRIPPGLPLTFAAMAKSKKKKKRKAAALAEGITEKPQALAVADDSKPIKRRKAEPKTSIIERTSTVVDTVRQFLREVRVELSKVTWPTRKDTIASTSVVLVIVFLIAAFLGIVDLGLSKLMRLLLS